jgi:dolichol-phosphate mannosyltransferase
VAQGESQGHRENTVSGAVSISVVIPVKNEEENVIPLLREVIAAFGVRDDYEIIFVDDGSTDATRDVLQGEKPAHPKLRLICHERNSGQSAAIRTGVLAARGRIIVTLDGDGQNDPADIPAVLTPLEAANAQPDLAMAAGQRRKRQDSMMKRVASSIANGVRQRLLKDGMRDTGCGLKAFTREGFLRLPYFDHMHRYLPALMLREGYLVVSVNVGHRPRRYGRSKYGVFDRLAVSVSDLMGVMWLKRRCRLPGARREL